MLQLHLSKTFSDDLKRAGCVMRAAERAEVGWLCDLPHPGPNEELLAVGRKCSARVWSQGLDRSVQAHIRQAAGGKNHQSGRLSKRETLTSAPRMI